MPLLLDVSGDDGKLFADEGNGSSLRIRWLFVASSCPSVLVLLLFSVMVFNVELLCCVVEWQVTLSLLSNDADDISIILCNSKSEYRIYLFVRE